MVGEIASVFSRSLVRKATVEAGEGRLLSRWLLVLVTDTTGKGVTREGWGWTGRSDGRGEVASVLAWLPGGAWNTPCWRLIKIQMSNTTSTLY